jgi:hypothetical protein
VDDREICDDDGYESFATGPLAAADCAVGTGLKERRQSSRIDAWDGKRAYGEDRYSTDYAR